MMQRRYAVPADEAVTTYLLRDIPVRIWRAAKARAQRENLDMRAVILRGLEEYARAGARSVGRATKAKKKASKKGTT